MQQTFAYPAGFTGLGPALRGFGLTVRTAQSVGIEWLDHARQSRDDLAAAAGKLAAAPNPAVAVLIQIDCLHTLTERFTARAATCADLLAVLAVDLARLGPGGGSGFSPATVPTATP